MPPKIRKLVSSQKEHGAIVNEDGTVFLPFVEQALTDKEIDKRVADINKLAASTIEVHQLFVDVAELVQGQQAYIDKIAKNVDDAHERTHSGLTKIAEASNMQRGTLPVASAIVDMLGGGAKEVISDRIDHTNKSSKSNRSTSGSKDSAAPVAMVNSASSSQRDTVEQIPKKPSSFLPSLFGRGKGKEATATNV